MRRAPMSAWAGSPQSLYARTWMSSWWTDLLPLTCAMMLCRQELRRIFPLVASIGSNRQGHGLIACDRHERPLVFIVEQLDLQNTMAVMPVLFAVRSLLLVDEWLSLILSLFDLI